jgi:hypothetical protein
MTRSAIRVLALTIFATTVAGAPAEAGTPHGKHITGKQITRKQITRKHIKRHVFRTAPPSWPGVSSPAPSGGVCPGMGRSFDCRIWPPPFDEDPDRKVSGSDGA